MFVGPMFFSDRLKSFSESQSVEKDSSKDGWHKGLADIFGP